jgi:hypothetical protein
MKALTLGLLKRVAWAYLLIAVIILALFALAPFTRTSELLNLYSVVTYVCIFCGPVALSFWLMRGIAPVLLTLPLRVQDAGRACWICGVGAPCAFIALMFGLGTSLVWIRGLPPLSLASTGVLGASAVAYLGTMFFLLTLMPSRPDPSANWQLKGILVGGGWGLMAGGGPLIAQSISHWETWQLWHWFVLAAGIALTFLGWVEAPSMLLRRARAVVNVGIDKHRVEQSLSFGRHDGGLNMLFRVSLKHTATLLMMMFLMMWMLQQFDFGRGGGLNSSLPSALAMTMLFSSFMAVQWFSGLRHLRSLPMSEPQLSGVFFCLLSLPPLLMGGMALLINRFLVVSTMATTLKLVVAFGGLAILVPALVLATSTLRLMPIFFAVFVGGQAFLAPQFDRFSFHLAAAVGLLAAGSGFALVHRSITKSSRCYRPGVFTRF